MCISILPFQQHVLLQNSICVEQLQHDQLFLIFFGYVNELKSLVNVLKKKLKKVTVTSSMKHIVSTLLTFNQTHHTAIHCELYSSTETIQLGNVPPEPMEGF